MFVKRSKQIVIYLSIFTKCSEATSSLFVLQLSTERSILYGRVVTHVGVFTSVPSNIALHKMLVGSKNNTHTTGGTEISGRLKNKILCQLLRPFFYHSFLRFLTLFCFKFIKHITIHKRMCIANESVNLAYVF